MTGCHDVLVWTALIPHPRVSCCSYLFKIKYFPDPTSVDMWASCFTLINKTVSESLTCGAYFLRVEPFLILGSWGQWKFEQWALCLQKGLGVLTSFPIFMPWNKNIMEKTTGSTNQRQWARDKHPDLSRVMSLELGVVKWGGFCPTDTNASTQWKGQWYESMQGNISWCWCSWQAGVLCCHCGTWRTSVIPQQQKQSLSICIQFPLTFLHQLHVLRKQ